MQLALPTCLSVSFVEPGHDATMTHEPGEFCMLSRVTWHLWDPGAGGEFCISLRRVFPDHLLISRKQKRGVPFCSDFSSFLARSSLIFFAECSDELSRQ